MYALMKKINYEKIKFFLKMRLQVYICWMVISEGERAKKEEPVGGGKRRANLSAETTMQSVERTTIQSVGRNTIRSVGNKEMML